MTLIRSMSRDDLDAVMRLEAASAEAPHWERAVYEGFLSQGGPVKQVFVARDDGRLAGFVAARVMVDVCELESIVVDAAVRKTGVGKALLATLVRWARGNNVVRVELEVRSGNDAAICFYERAGFRRDGLRRGYYRNPEEDAVLMSLALASGSAA